MLRIRISLFLLICLILLPALGFGQPSEFVVIDSPRLALKQKEKMVENNDLGFRFRYFDINEDARGNGFWYARVILAQSDYNEENLICLFRWFSCRHSAILNEELKVDVFTGEEKVPPPNAVQFSQSYRPPQAKLYFAEALLHE